MDFLKKWFFGEKNLQKIEQPNVLFGRFSDVEKTPRQNELWSEAGKKFDENQYFESVKLVAEYLKNTLENNIFWIKNDEKHLEFHLTQGSKKIRVRVDESGLRAESVIAQIEVENVSFMRQLVELNRFLKLSKFAINPKNQLVMVFNSSLLDASPLKIFSGLKELATQSDKRDDILIDQFSALITVNEGVILPIPEKERRVKIEYLRREIARVFQNIDAADADAVQNTGIQAYFLLELVYRLDFLVRPEGFSMETFERIHRNYFENNDKNRMQKIAAGRRELSKIAERSDEKLEAELYRTIGTFSVLREVGFEKIQHFIDNELNTLTNLKESQKQDFAPVICGYVVGFCLFNYLMPKPLYFIFELFYQINHRGFYHSLGFNFEFSNSDAIDPQKLKLKIKEICRSFQTNFSNLKPPVELLKFDSKADFCISYLTFIRNLDFSEKR